MINERAGSASKTHALSRLRRSGSSRELPRLRLTAPIWLTVVLVSTGCASADVRPGTGDLSFRLTWTGSADLDLYVRSPLGEQIYFLSGLPVFGLDQRRSAYAKRSFLRLLASGDVCLLNPSDTFDGATSPAL